MSEETIPQSGEAPRLTHRLLMERYRIPPELLNGTLEVDGLTYGYRLPRSFGQYRRMLSHAEMMAELLRSGAVPPPLERFREMPPDEIREAMLVKTLLTDPALSDEQVLELAEECGGLITQIAVELRARLLPVLAAEHAALADAKNALSAPEKSSGALTSASPATASTSIPTP